MIRDRQHLRLAAVRTLGQNRKANEGAVKRMRSICQHAAGFTRGIVSQHESAQDVVNLAVPTSDDAAVHGSCIQTL